MGLNISSGISGGLSGASTGATIGSVIPGVGTAVGAIGGGALGLIGGLFSGGGGPSLKQQEEMQKRMMAESWKYEQIGMGLQYDYNEKAAEANQERALEMWDKTNAEAQREHLENAGLSVGMMYGNGGVMRPSEASGNQGGVNGMTQNPVQAALAVQQMGLQLESIKAQNKKAEAEANMANAEAATKLAELPQKGLDFEIKKFEKEIKGMETDITASNVTQYAALAQKAVAEMQTVQNEAEISNATKQQKIQTVVQNLINIKLEGLSKIVEMVKTDAERQKIAKEIKYYFYDVVTRRMSAEAAKTQAESMGKYLSDNIELGNKGLELNRTKMWGDWISGGVGDILQLIGKLAGGKTGAIMDVIDTVTSTWSDGHGNKTTKTHSERKTGGE